MAGLVPSVVAGLIVGVLVVVIAMSFAALIFSGPLTVFLPTGTSILLFSSVVILGVVAWRAGVPGMVALPQDTVSAITALSAASVAAGAADAGADVLASVVALMMVASLVLGVTFYALGAFRLGNLARFLPYPVVGGFLAGTGWLLVDGGAGVVAGASISLLEPETLMGWTTAAHLLPGFAFALALLLALRFRSHFMIIPGFVVGSIALFYAVLLVTGTSIAEAEAGGWLLGPFPETAAWRPLTVDALAGAHWASIAGEAVRLGTLAILGVVALLLNASGVELETRRDADLNAELRAAGVAGFAAAAAGGLGGYHALSLSILSIRTAGPRRAPGFIAAGVCAVALVASGSMLRVFPRPVLGGLVLFLGLAFLSEWVLDARRRLPRPDYAIVLGILGVIAVAGFLAGVVAGVVAALVLFVVSYSRTRVVRHELSLATFRSRVDRPAAHRDVLRNRGDEVAVLELQGFVFFGTANALLEMIRSRASAPGRPPLAAVVLDFASVTGLDSSAVASFQKARHLAEAEEFTLVLTGMSETVARQIAAAPATEVVVFPDLDHGVEWCEDRLIGEVGTPPAAGLAAVVGDRIDIRRLARYLKPVELETGEPLIRQGEAADALFFLEAGRMTVTMTGDAGRTLRLRRIMPGTVVGEVGLYGGEDRTASVVADEPCRARRLSAESLERMRAKDPELAASVHEFVARLLAERLASTSRSLEAHGRS